MCAESTPWQAGRQAYRHPDAPQHSLEQVGDLSLAGHDTFVDLVGEELGLRVVQETKRHGGAVAKRHADVVPVRPRLTQVPELLGALVHACRELGRNQHLEHAGWQHRDGGVRGDGHARVHALLDAVHHLVLAAERRRVDVVQVQHCTRAVAQSK